jgi:hypothetical protein
MWDDESMDARTVGFVKSSLIVRNGHPKTPFLAVSALWPLRQEKGGRGRFLKETHLQWQIKLADALHSDLAVMTLKSLSSRCLPASCR